MLRKHAPSLKTHFFPALALMMASSITHEPTLEEWYISIEDEEITTRDDACSIAADSISRIAAFLGEKTLLGACGMA
jgi:hypothetical protein